MRGVLNTSKTQKVSSIARSSQSCETPYDLATSAPIGTLSISSTVATYGHRMQTKSSFGLSCEMTSFFIMA